MVIMAKNIGFCNGVKNSIDKTIELLNENKKIYVLGMLVHNENVINDLKNKGVIFVDDINEVPNNSHIVLRAHGVSNDIYEKCNEKELIVHDLTCPNVLNIHKKIRELNEKGYFIIICGHKNHPEVTGELSLCNGIVVSNITDIKDIENEKIALLCQTTISNEIFEKIKNYLINKYPDILIYNTICNATKKREEEAFELSKKVDNLLVIGSKKSSNTKKLYDVSICENTYLVDDIDNFDLKLKGDIGIITGASSSIEDAKKLMKKYI